MPQAKGRRARLTREQRRTIANLRALEFKAAQIAELLSVPHHAVTACIATLPSEKAKRQRLAEEKARRAELAKIPREERLRMESATRRAHLEANYWPEIEKIEAQRWESGANLQNSAARG